MTRNIVVAEKPPLEGFPLIGKAISSAVETLSTLGRVVVRYSGTEPLARVMIEGEDEAQISALADDIAAAIRECVPTP